MGDQATRERPRVLVIPPSYFPTDTLHGGGERYAREYSRALAELTPTTLGFFDNEPRTEYDGSLQVRTFAVRHFRPGPSFPLTLETVRALKDFDVIHVMVFPMPLTDVLILFARLRGQRVVLTDVGGGAPCLSTYLQRISRRLDLTRAAHGLAHLSEYASSFFTDWPQPYQILYGGADLGGFAVSPTPPEGYALFVGRLLPHKGVRQLIDALPAELPLRIVGRAGDAAYLESLHSAARGKNVRFIMDADESELRRQYAGANVVLQPSLPSIPGVPDKAELLGLVTLEGMASGRPVIVTKYASMPELVVDGVTGYTVEPYNADELRDRVQLLLSDPGLAISMGASARAHVEANFTWGATAARGLSFYTSGKLARASGAWGKIRKPPDDSRIKG